MKNTWPLYLITISAFFLLIGDSLLTTGMFMDGLIYSNVAANMAEGTCSFWQPTLSCGLFPHFYEHPPLAMGLLALLYRLFGTSLWVTRLYSMLMTCMTAYLMLRIWRRMGYKGSMGWLPLLLWTLVPAVTLNSHNNMLECTMAVFDLAAVLCMMHSASSSLKRLLWSLLAGVFVFLAFLTKGFTGLYPLAFPLIVWMVEQLFVSSHSGKTWNISLPVALLYTLIPIVAATVCFGLTLLLCPQSGNFFAAYMQQQVLSGIATPVVSTRFHILIKFFEQTVIVWAIFLIVLFVHRFIHINRTAAPGVLQADTVVEELVMSTRQLQWKERRWQHFLGFMLLTLSGVLPIMISLKQRSFYILTVYPYFALAIAAVLNDIVEGWLAVAGKTFRWVTAVVACVLAAGAVLLNGIHYGEPGRDVVMQQDMEVILPLLQRGEKVAMPAVMGTEYSLISYYYREHRVQLYGCPMQSSPSGTLPEHILTNGSPLDSLASYYQEIPIQTKQYKLYKRL